MAIHVVSVRRAFTLLAKRVAEVVSVEENKYLTYNFDGWIELSRLQAKYENATLSWVRTVSLKVLVPRVIRLGACERLAAPRVRFNRRNLYARDANRCQYCGRDFPAAELSVDHVVPRSQGGHSTWDNVVCACTGCNARKGGRTPQQARMRLIRPPKRPTRPPVLSQKAGLEIYRSWKHFLDEAYWSVELK
ncbi:MAG: HNH endonuclease [Planctomycetes bacterium]|nr:HNH endonuclease [Planctomycetota bacterium]